MSLPQGHHHGDGLGVCPGGGMAHQKIECHIIARKMFAVS